MTIENIKGECLYIYIWKNLFGLDRAYWGIKKNVKMN